MNLTLDEMRLLVDVLDGSRLLRLNEVIGIVMLLDIQIACIQVQINVARMCGEGVG